MRDSNDGGWGASRVARDVISGCNGSLDLLGVQWMKLLKKIRSWDDDSCDTEPLFCAIFLEYPVECPQCC